MITHEEAKAWFDYDATTGRLVRKDGAPWKLTFYQLPTGYRHTSIKGKTCYEHRLVFLWHHGFVPKEVDHIDCDKTNIRIENLRAATPTQNRHNVRKRRHNTTGAKGVVFHPKCRLKPFQAKIAKGGRVFSFGYYASIEEAVKAYEIGAKRVAGDFARCDFNVADKD